MARRAGVDIEGVQRRRPQFDKLSMCSRAIKEASARAACPRCGLRVVDPAHGRWNIKT
ncbi:hypothetical protein BRPE64_BCDS12670 [Caballeronia insecticola]|uniref:Uncharacterized protein n=1 Tax=Caballeronia insecticola TaxID=758793 RepID=R4WMS4_9BURK|nr:hypothetical protein BRPE64_BCDS12670 [Caballeronia insecticola]